MSETEVPPTQPYTLPPELIEVIGMIETRTQWATETDRLQALDLLTSLEGQ